MGCAGTAEADVEGWLGQVMQSLRVEVSEKPREHAVSKLVKEATASVLVFRRGVGGGWLLGLAEHKRFGGFLPAGGHQEDDETAAEAAIRETLEELGCRIRLVPGPTTPLPEGFPHRPMVAPWWITEMPASPDNHTRAPHVHVDHLFVAVWDGDAGEPETEVRWFDERELVENDAIPEDVRLPAKDVFARLEEILAAAQ
jgi:8-oxo-dGTP pyrophosphatase MutT (NUDIX family)